MSLMIGFVILQMQSGCYSISGENNSGCCGHKYAICPPVTMEIYVHLMLCFIALQIRGNHSWKIIEFTSQPIQRHVSAYKVTHMHV